MPEKLTLAIVMSRFLQSRPNYKVKMEDIHECMYFVARHFNPLFWSTEGIIPTLRRTVESQKQEIAELKRELATKK